MAKLTFPQTTDQMLVCGRGGFGEETQQFLEINLLSPFTDDLALLLVIKGPPKKVKSHQPAKKWAADLPRKVPEPNFYAGFR